MKKYYFFSYCMQSCVPGKSVINIFKNGVSEEHPFVAIATISKNETISISHVVKTEAILMSYREISETEYLLFQN